MSTSRLTRRIWEPKSVIKKRRRPKETWGSLIAKILEDKTWKKERDLTQNRKEWSAFMDERNLTISSLNT